MGQYLLFFYGWLVNFKGASLPPHVFISGTALIGSVCNFKDGFIQRGQLFSASALKFSTSQESILKLVYWLMMYIYLLVEGMLSCSFESFSNSKIYNLIFIDMVRQLELNIGLLLKIFRLESAGR